MLTANYNAILPQNIMKAIQMKGLKQYAVAEKAAIISILVLYVKLNLKAESQS